MPCPPGAVGLAGVSCLGASQQPPSSGLGRGQAAEGKGLHCLGSRAGNQPRRAGLSSPTTSPLLLSNLILPCFIAGPLSSVTGKSFQCPGSLLQRQRGRGCSF